MVYDREVQEEILRASQFYQGYRHALSLVHEVYVGPAYVSGWAEGAVWMKTHGKTPLCSAHIFNGLGMPCFDTPRYEYWDDREDREQGWRPVCGTHRNVAERRGFIIAERSGVRTA